MSLALKDIRQGDLHRYRAFGLTISSEIALPELTPDPETALRSETDLTITRLDAQSSGWSPIVSDIPRVTSGSEWAELDFPGAGRFRVDAGARKIECHVSLQSGHLVRLPLLGPVMATFLHLSGKLVLHASAVETETGTIAFLGDKGAGKSTTAAAFIRNGFRLVTDDLLVCQPRNPTGCGCSYAYPQLKLTPDTHRALPITDAEDVAPPFPSFAKIQQRVVTQPLGSTEPQPLRAICVLGRGNGLAVVKASPEEALSAVLRFSYVLRYGEAFSVQGGGGVLFRSAAALASRVPCLRVTMPSALDRLDADVPAAFEMICSMFSIT